mgnify:CR=1 FL=1
MSKADETGKQKRCFVVGPIGETGSNIRAQSDWLLNGVIRPVAEKKGLSVQRSDEVPAPGDIGSQVINLVHDSDIVIADLTNHNPNAFYELAIRHMARKPVVHMIHESERIPFDVGTYRTIRYSLYTYGSFEKAKTELEQHLDYIINNPDDVDNPVVSARGRLQELENATPEEHYLINAIDELQSRMRDLEENQASLRSKQSLPTNNLRENPTAGPYALVKIDNRVDKHQVAKEVADSVTKFGMIVIMQPGELIKVQAPTGAANIFGVLQKILDQTEGIESVDFFV